MPEPAEILKTIAAEYEASATARRQWVTMAEGNAHRPNLPKAQVDEHLQAAAKARQAVAHFEARAAAARAGAQALEANRG